MCICEAGGYSKLYTVEAIDRLTFIVVNLDSLTNKNYETVLLLCNFDKSQVLSHKLLSLALCTVPKLLKDGTLLSFQTKKYIKFLFALVIISTLETVYSCEP